MRSTRDSDILPALRVSAGSEMLHRGLGRYILGAYLFLADINRGA